MHHFNPLAQPGVPSRIDEAGLVLAQQIFGSRRFRPADPRAGANITITPDALGVVIASTGGGGVVDDASAVLADAAFLPHPSRLLPETVQAGSHITVTRNAMGPVIASDSAVLTSALDLIENKDIAAPATSVTFAGLNGDTDEVYLLVYRLVKNTAAVMLTTLRPNGVTTNQRTTYNYSGWQGGGPVSGAFNITTMEIGANGGASGALEFGHLWITAKTGFARMGHGHWAQSDGADLLSIVNAMHWTDTAANIVSLDVVADQANGIGAGSYFRLFKLKKTTPAPNAAEVTLALTAVGTIFTTTVVGQPWVTATSKLVASLMAVANGGTTPEMVLVSGVVVGTMARVAGVGFDVWAYNPNGFEGTITVHVIGV